jgi:hypothetical protein
MTSTPAKTKLYDKRIAFAHSKLSTTSSNSATLSTNMSTFHDDTKLVDESTDNYDDKQMNDAKRFLRKSFEFDTTDLSSSALKKSFEAEGLNQTQSLNKTNELGFISDNDLNKNNLHNYELSELLSDRLCNKVVYMLAKLSWDGITGSSENAWKVFHLGLNES